MREEGGTRIEEHQQWQHPQGQPMPPQQPQQEQSLKTKVNMWVDKAKAWLSKHLDDDKPDARPQQEVHSSVQQVNADGQRVEHEYHRTVEERPVAP